MEAYVRGGALITGPYDSEFHIATGGFPYSLLLRAEPEDYHCGGCYAAIGIIDVNNEGFTAHLQTDTVALVTWEFVRKT